MKEKGRPDVVLVNWQEEDRSLTLEGETVLQYRLSWPQLEGAGRAGAQVSRYYARLAEAWRARWGRELYWRACLALVQCRAAGRPFRPWSGKLSGAVTTQEEKLLCLRLESEETWGDGRKLQGCWGDVWDLKYGSPCGFARAAGGGRSWRRELLAQAVQTGNERRAAGDCFLDQGWEVWLRKNLSRCSFCLTPGQIEILLPQCAAAPAAEGVVSLRVPRAAGAEQSIGRDRQ